LGWRLFLAGMPLSQRRSQSPSFPTVWEEPTTPSLISFVRSVEKSTGP
jgi:hypothetical protein